MFVSGATEYNIYLAVQLITLFAALSMIVVAAVHKPSKGQGVVMLFLFSAIIYLLGFTIETLSSTVEGYHMACIIEYVGETFVFVAFLHFIAFLCRLNVPRVAYIFQGAVSLFIIYLVTSTQTNHIFYKNMYVINDGPFPHLGLDYGPGFIFTICYIALLSAVLMFFVVKFMKTANEVERKRCICTMLSVFSAWAPYLFKLLGLTGGYEIPGPGMVMAGFFLLIAIERYGFMDSIVLAGERVIENGSYAVAVLDSDFRLEYENDRMKDIIGTFDKYASLKNHEEIKRIIDGNLGTLQKNDKIYDIKLDELKDAGFVQGYMILMFDNTVHYRDVDKIRYMAMRDTFTGLYNRTTYREMLEEELSNETSGAFVMMDVDNFKHVNDKYGHGAGDEILKILADILLEYPKEEMLACRLGGDEFSCFLLNATDEDRVKMILSDISGKFENRLEEKGYTRYTSISIGAVIVESDAKSEHSFDKLYSFADEIMYEVKQSGKDAFFVKKYVTMV